MQLIYSHVSRLGEAETRLVLTKMIFNFDIELCPETEAAGPWSDQQVFLSWQKKPLYVRLTPVDKDKSVGMRMEERVGLGRGQKT